ncbi:hypothetical protein FE773_00140 [Caminibacter mediatlanticus TB-2]|uniref:Extracellular solute-binding protein n=1 Tax=Caminibacter mediatlanticus TB-2 TaxID=391592 RepID=A0ABX5VEF3_9BACT|nr:hypothetical protein FE773_00140 [Caminibacter mediatlanticus TB-2]
MNQPVSTLKTDKNVKDTRIFINFLLSKEAQLQVVKQNYILILKGIKPPKDYGDISKIKIIKTDPKVINKNIEKIKKNLQNFLAVLNRLRIKKYYLSFF